MKESKQRKYDIAYLKMAQEWAKLSYCKRKQVGALIVKDKMIISDGYNGTPTGFENICEDEDNYTKWYVLHAEANASGENTQLLRETFCCLHTFSVLLFGREEEVFQGGQIHGVLLHLLHDVSEDTLQVGRPVVSSACRVSQLPP